MRPARILPAAALLIALAACTPTMNWRDTRPQGSDVVMLFPCRPDRDERAVRVAGDALRMQMYSCHAGGALFSLAFVDASDVSRVAPLLLGLRAAAAANVGGSATVRAIVVPGATPNEQSALLRIEGHLPDGRVAVEQAAFFVNGLRLYQATALGDSPAADALEIFFGSIKIVMPDASSLVAPAGQT
jgi:hypothetical protein